MEKEYSFDDVVLFARTGLNPRQNFKLGKGNNVYITIKNIQNNSLIIDKNTDYIDDAAIEKIHKRSQIKKGDILFASIGRIGDMYIISDDPIGWDINESVFAFTLNTKIIRQKYFYYYFKNPAVMDYIMRNSSGSTFKSIKMNQLKRMTFLLPDLNEQDNIISELDNAASIIQNHIVLQEKLDNLIKSRFVEMFGTYPENQKSWTIGTIRELVIDVRYGSSRKAADGNSGRYPYLRMNNITYGGELDLADIKTIDVPDEELDKCMVQRGDLLFNRTNSRELVGKTCVYNRDERMVLAGFIIRVRLNSKAVPEFVSAFLNMDFSKKMLFNMCKTAIGQANINAQELQSIGIYIPPIELQKEFVSFKNQVDKLKVAVQKSLDKAQTLFDSLMQQYFG